MKLTKYLPLAALAALALSCSEEPQLPPVSGPVATIEPNMTVLELKQKYWQTDRNYVSTVGLNDRGDSIVIHGTVISSDESGNIYKSMMINDGTSALTIAVNAYDLYQTYQYGQEVYINVTGLKLGGYNGLMQLGGEGSYNGSPSMTFMAEADMTSHAQQNGWGSTENAAKYIIDTDIPTLTTAKATAEGLQNWQSQLIRLDGVHFEDAGEQFAPSSNTNRYMVDADGNRINLRCSSYADFAKDVIPSGSGSVTGILSYYGSDWQMLLINLDGLQGFDSTDEPANPDDGTPKFVRATEVVSGGRYVLWADNTVSNPMPADKNFNYLYVTKNVTPDADGAITTTAANAYTFTQTDKGWTIQDSQGIYLYMQGTYTSFQLSTTLDAANENFYWTITPAADGTFEIVNVGTDGLIQYFAEKSSYGCYADRNKGVLPSLYQSAK